jgi:hypothetical protein
VGHPISSLALRGKNSVARLVAWALAHGNGGNGRPGIDDIVSLEALLDVLIELLLKTSITFDIKCEQIFRGSLLDYTTGDELARKEKVVRSDLTLG